MKILTFDIEEWFHLLDHDSTRKPSGWSRFEVRIHANMDRIFGLLERSQSKATFFCLGWIAEKYPEVIKEISQRGYEIGSHSHTHQLAYEQTPDEFARDIERSVKTIEDLTGNKVRTFRAPGFSVGESNCWAFEVLAGLGIDTDCSVFPAARAHGGMPSYPRPVPSIISYRGISIRELPINYATALGRPLVYSGGGYFRLLPYGCIRHFTSRADYVMAYFHPRDFDAGQPVIEGLSRLRRFKSYVNLKGALPKLERWLTEFAFTDVCGAAATVDWNSVPVVEIN
jgi:polysaccharide deacetylase family protein (PEP-CTERM system associated)